MMIIDCLYCGERQPHSDEHILQKGLGGNLTFKNVCRPCNTSFSSIDQSLTDYSVVALSRLLETPASKQVTRASSELIYDSDSDLWKEVIVTNKFAVEVLPQLHYRNGKVSLAGQTEELLRTFVAELEAFLKSGKYSTQRIRVDDECGTARIAMRRKGQFIVRAPSLNQGKEFLGDIETQWAKIKEIISSPRPHTIIDPKFQGRLQVDLNGTYRAVAKTVFNYLAYRRGVFYARQIAFENIREYIRGKNLLLPEPSEENWAVDSRFVKSAGYGKLNLLATETHSIEITAIAAQLCGILTLYGKHTFIVLLGSAESDFIPLAHEFSIDGSFNRELSLKDMVARRRAAIITEINTETEDA